MAQQTKDSTVQISQLIENVSNAIQMVVEVSGSMISMIESQNETTEKTAESFTVIEKNSDNVYGQSNELAAYVTKLGRCEQENCGQHFYHFGNFRRSGCPCKRYTFRNGKQQCDCGRTGSVKRTA